MNMIQSQLELVPSIVTNEDKGEYIQSLVDSRENAEFYSIKGMIL